MLEMGVGCVREVWGMWGAREGLLDGCWGCVGDVEDVCERCEG